MDKHYFLQSETASLLEGVFPAKIESATPSAYRLCVKKSGEKVLQGAFEWRCGNEHGYEWRDIPEVKGD